MKTLLNTNLFKKLVTCTILAGAAVLLTRVAVAYDCPWSNGATCGTTDNPDLRMHCYGNNGDLGYVTCWNDTVCLPGQGCSSGHGHAKLTATSTVDLQGTAMCGSTVQYWTAAQGTSSQIDCAPGIVAVGPPVKCRGINVPQSCN